MITVENNKLIAEFMGNSFEPLPDTNNKCFFLLGSWEVIHITDFETGVYAYHSDWNKLMPVVFKCLEICHNEMLNEWEDGFSDSFFSRDINCMYSEVVRFIKWYNNQQK